jgi:hypothetical protein
MRDQAGIDLRCCREHAADTVNFVAVQFRGPNGAVKATLQTPKDTAGGGAVSPDARYVQYCRQKHV